MSTVYTRPELTKADLKAFQVAKYVTLNPKREDVLKALTVAEKSSTKNRLSEQDALAAFDNFTNQNVATTFAGDYYCEPHWRYPVQGTVMQLVRLTDSMTGLICDRQQVAPGQKSNPPLSIEPDGLLSGKSPLSNLNRALTFFWPYLPDAALDELHNQCSLYVMSKLVPARKEALARQQELIAKRKHSLAELYRNVKPEFTTEFAQHCQTIANDLQQQRIDSITWSDMKKQYPATSSRYKAQLLGILDNNKATVQKLSRAECQTEFDVRLSTWSGDMRLFDVPQLVLQLRNIPVHRRFAEKSQRHREISSEIKGQARQSPHPATENTIGWLRIHIDDENKLCFVDEVQSDALELALKYSHDRRYTEAAQEFMRDCSPWHLHAFATVYQWANNIGYRAAIHSRESAEKIAFMTRSERKWTSYYSPIIKKFALQRHSVEQYPDKIFIGK